MDDGRKRVGAVGTSFRLIHELEGREPTPLMDLVETLDMPKSTVYVHLKTLQDLGYVRESDGGYQLTLRFLRLGAAQREQEIFTHAKREVHTLAEELDEVVNLMTEKNGNGVYLYSVGGTNAVNIDTSAGRYVDLHSTALGKAMLAFMDRERVEWIVDEHGLPARTSRTITDRGVLFEELETIRERGLAYDEEENLTGIRCIAAPVVGESEVLGALSVAGPKSRMDDPEIEERVEKRLRDVTNIIEVNVSYS